MTHPTTPDQGDERRAFEAARDALHACFEQREGAMRLVGRAVRLLPDLERVLSAARPVAQEARDPISDPEIVAIRTALDWISTGKNSTGKELADRAYLALGRVRAMIAAPQPSQGAQPVVDQEPASMSDNGSCGSQVSGKPVAQEANVKVGGSTVYVTNNHRRESNRWWATVYPGFDDDDKRVSVEECDAIARKIADALNAIATPHRPVSAEPGKGVEDAAELERIAAVVREITPQARQVGLFSVSANGELCFHAGETDAKLLCETLDEGVTGGPYTALVAFASPSESVAVSGEVSERIAKCSAILALIDNYAPEKLGTAERTHLAVAVDAVLALAGSGGKEAAALERMARLDDEIGDAP